MTCFRNGVRRKHWWGPGDRPAQGQALWLPVPACGEGSGRHSRLVPTAGEELPSLNSSQLKGPSGSPNQTPGCLRLRLTQTARENLSGSNQPRHSQTRDSKPVR